jgi:citronellol/citronellal dehydrogenase
MQQINARGTYLVSRTCIPHLKRAANPHVLMLSPPLDMNPKWFRGHTAYTMAKFGMSMCVLGMAAEFADEGIAFNALWPRTGVATAAIRNALAGDEGMKHCRTTDVLSDAAYLIFNKPAKNFTGRFLIDDNFLAENGVTDFDQYRVDPTKDLMPDFFVPDSIAPPPGVSLKALKSV